MLSRRQPGKAMSRSIDYGNLMHRAMRGLIQDVLIDVRDNGIGSVSSVSRVGVNYYYSRRTRFMFNAMYADIAGDTRHNETDGYAASVRLQFLF